MKFLCVFLFLLSTVSFASENYSSKAEWEIPPDPSVYQSVHESGIRIKEFNTVIEFFTDTKGKVIKANVEKSSGSRYIDNAVKNSILKAKMKPYIEDGKVYPIHASQPFSMQNKYYQEGPIYRCSWSAESTQSNLQKTYKTADEALEHLDYVYIEHPSLFSTYETNKRPESEDKIQMGKYDAILTVDDYGESTVVRKILPMPQDEYSTLAHATVFVSKIKPRIQSKSWRTKMKDYHDTITLFKQCVLEP